jgi:putative protease
MSGEEKKVGKIVKFFARPSVAAIEMTGGELKIGDKIRIKGHTTDFEQEITSMEIDNKPVQKAEKGQLIGIKVKDRVRPNDDVFKIID